MMKVLIAGCGDLGLRTAGLLIKEGHKVIGLRRRPNGASVDGQVEISVRDHPMAGFSWLTADLSNPASLTTLPAGITHVVFAASPDRRQENAYRAVFLEGLQHLVQALKQTEPEHDHKEHSGIQRFLFVSSSAVYGEHADQWVDEDTPTQPQGFNGRILVEAEKWLMAQSFPSVVLRLSGIYGPGRDQLLDRIRHGQTSVPRRTAHWSNRIHVEDAARAIVHLMTLPDPENVYLVTDGNPYPMDVLYDRLAQKLGAPKPAEGPAPIMIGSKKLSSARLLASGFKLAWPDALEGYLRLIDNENVRNGCV